MCLSPAIAKDKVCESSPIDLNIVAFGQWNLAKSGGKERCLKMDHQFDPDSNSLILNLERIVILVLIPVLIPILILMVILISILLILILILILIMIKIVILMMIILIQD